MTRAELLEYYSRFTEGELFYREYYRAQGNAEAMRVITQRLKNNQEQFPTLWLPELMQHGSEFLPEVLIRKNDDNVSVQRHERYNPLFEHYHIFFEIIYVMRGGCINTIEKHKLVMETGDLCIMAPGVKHSMAVYDDETIVLNILVRESTFKETFFDIFKDNAALSLFFYRVYYSNNKESFLCFHTGGNVKLEELLDIFFTESIECNRYSAKVMENTLRVVFCVLLREDPEEISLTQKIYADLDMMEVLRYIQENYKTITFSNLSEHFNLSPSYMRCILKQRTGETFVELVRKIRMQKACMLLRHSNMQVVDIAAYVGYESPEYFTRKFKEEYSMTPIEYRNQTGENR